VTSFGHSTSRHIVRTVHDSMNLSDSITLAGALTPAGVTQPDYRELEGLLRKAIATSSQPAEVAEEVRRSSPKFASLADWLNSRESLATWLMVILYVLDLLLQPTTTADIDVQIEQTVIFQPTDEQVRPMIEEALRHYEQEKSAVEPSVPRTEAAGSDDPPPAPCDGE
jgi:hypothetical protein